MNLAAKHCLCVHQMKSMLYFCDVTHAEYCITNADSIHRNVNASKVLEFLKIVLHSNYVVRLGFYFSLVTHAVCAQCHGKSMNF